MDKFKIIEIKKCTICGKENVSGYKEMISEDIGIGESSGCEEFCVDCFDENTFDNSYGFTFLKHKKKLFCYKPFYCLDFGFREILSDKDIERAFNPEYYEFMKWMNK